MSALVFGRTPPGEATVVKPHKPTPCELPHFTRSGDPKYVAGLVYISGDVTQVLCATHGKQRYGL